jgi:hypothetical protein
MNPNAITIEATPIEPIDVTLVDKKYTIVPPKAALAMRLAVESKLYEDDPAKMAEVLGVWIKKAFGDKAAKIQARLDDEDDLLDIVHIMTLMEKVIEHQMDEDPTS